MEFLLGYCFTNQNEYGVYGKFHEFSTCTHKEYETHETFYDAGTLRNDGSISGDQAVHKPQVVRRLDTG